MNNFRHLRLPSTVTKKLISYGVALSVALTGGFLIVPHEGSVVNKLGQHVVYKDVVGVPTACWGQTNKDYLGRNIELGMKYTEEECYKQLAKSLPRYQEQMLRYVKVPLTPYQEAALISFTYNVGVGNFAKSTLLKKLNQGNYQGACEELRKWVYAGGKKYQGLVNRREDEYKMCIGAYKDKTVGMLRNWETQYDFTTEIITPQTTTEEVHQVF